MKKSTFALSFLVLALSVPAVHAAGKQGYASARAACLAQAGTNEREFSQRRASFQSGAIYKQCMTAKGYDVVVRRGDGSRLY
ncbi:hypothetical protein [Bradyrhizobium sp. URHC0002]